MTTQLQSINIIIIKLFRVSRKVYGLEFIPDNLHFAVCSALENDRRVSQNRPRPFYRVSILSCASVWEVYRTFYRVSILFPPSVRELYALSTGCSIYLVLQFGKYIELSIGCPFYFIPQSGKYIALSTGCPFISFLSLGCISHFLQCPFYLVPQFGKYIALSTGCPFYLVLQLGKYITLSTECPLYLVPQGGISHLLQGVHFILSLNFGSISHRKPLSGSNLVALRESSTTQGTLNYREKTLL